MRRAAITLSVVAVIVALASYANRDKAVPATTTGPIIVEPSGPSDPIGTDDREGEATDVTAAKAEAQSLQWQIEIMQDQLEKAREQVASSSVEPEADPKAEPQVSVSSSSGHYERRRVRGRLFRQRVWIED